MSDTSESKIVTVTFHNESDDGGWSYEILIDDVVEMSFSCDPSYRPEDCLRERDFEDFDKMESLLKRIEELVRDGYTIEYKYSNKEPNYWLSEDDEIESD